MKNILSDGMTDPGLKRKKNEDSYLISDEFNLYFVADGMGGHQAGEIASAAATKTLLECAKQYKKDSNFTCTAGPDSKYSFDENFILTAAKLANHSILLLAENNPDLQGMGTTISGAKISGSHATIANVGDSRVYYIKNNTITQITSDHSWVNEQVQKNDLTKEEARTHKWKNIITRALGNKVTIDVDFFHIDLANDDILLLCSDGLSGMVEDDAMLTIILQYKDDLHKACRELIKAANAGGGADNITVVLVKYIFQ